MIITRKIELWIDEPETNKRNETWNYLRNLNNDVFKAANLIVSNQYFNKAFLQRIILNDDELKKKSEDIDNKIKKIFEKIRNENDNIKKDILLEKRKSIYKTKNSLTKEAREKAVVFYTTGEKNVTYQILKDTFPEMPSYVKAALNDMINKNFDNEWNNVQRGDRSIRSYRKGLPIPFMKSSMKFEEKDEEIYLHWINSIIFRLQFGRDKSNNRTIVKRAIDGHYKYSDSSIQIKDKKIFLLFCVEIPDEKVKLDTNLSVGVDLGLAIPAYCAISEGFEKLPIGHKNDFLRVRIQMQSRKRQLQKSITLTSGGKGRNKKLKALESFKEKERNYVHTYNHMISHRVVEFANKYKAANIKLEFLEGYGKDNEGKSLKGDFVLRNWSYYELQKMIEEKAKRKGMKVVNIDPYHTSQTCAVCGHYEEGQRKNQADFICKNKKCKNFDKKVNADYNAALNIAKSNKVINKKEECKYYKK